MAKKPHFRLKNYTDDPALIILVFNYAGKRIVVSTGVSCPQKYWNKAAERVKENKAFRQHAKINGLLNRLEAQTVDLHYDFKALGIVPSPDKFKDALLQKIQRREDGRPAMFDFMRMFIEERKGMKRPASSIRVYQNSFNHLEAYAKDRKKNMDFGDITEAFKNDFLAYLFSQQPPFSDSYVHKILTTLRTFLKDAYKRGICPHDVTAKVRLSIPKRGAENIYLTEREIETLYRLEGLGERLEAVRDLFLVGCLTGLRFSDFTAIQPENAREIEHAGKEVKCLVITTKKTKQRVVLPLVNPMLVSILDKYAMKAPKVISNQKLNKYLKEVAQAAAFDEPVEITEYRAGRPEKKVYQKWELVSSHTARRSFATNAYKRGLPATEIMKFTGHTTVASFMNYIKVTGDETAVVLSEHDFFTGKSPLKAIK